MDDLKAYLITINLIMADILDKGLDEEKLDDLKALLRVKRLILNWFEVQYELDNQPTQPKEMDQVTANQL